MLTTRIEALNPSSAAIEAATQIEMLMTYYEEAVEEAATALRSGSLENAAAMLEDADGIMDDANALLRSMTAESEDVWAAAEEYITAADVDAEATRDAYDEAYEAAEAVDPAVTALIEEIEATAAEARDASDADSAAEAILTAGPLLEEAWPAEYGTDAYDDIDTAAESLRDALPGAWETWAETHVQERAEVIEVDGREVEVTWKPIDITANSSRPDDTFEGRVYAFAHCPVGVTDPGWDQTRIVIETEDGEDIRLWGRGSEEYDGGRIASSYREEEEDAALAPGGYRVTLL